MAKCTQISFTQGEMNKQLTPFFASLLEKDVVDAILIPMNQPKNGVMQTLVTNPEMLADIDPFAPVVPINSAKLASSLTTVASGKRVALVMRSCEVRAMIELVKLKQANLDDVLVIGMDCLGRFENKNYKMFTLQDGTAETFISKALTGATEQDGYDISPACSICEFPATTNSDLRIGPIGAGTNSIIVEAMTDKGTGALEVSGATLSDTPAGRKDAIAKLTTTRFAARDEKFAAFRETTSSFDGLEDKLAGCINCYNCRVACPVCYCKECVFVTDTFRHKGEQFINWAQNSGQLKMPTDTTFYHLTRMTHISTFCVGCGQCTSACPNDIDLMPLFRTSAQKAQERFDYEAGRSVDDEQPLAVFESDELVEVTGQVK